MNIKQLGLIWSLILSLFFLTITSFAQPDLRIEGIKSYCESLAKDAKKLLGSGLDYNSFMQNCINEQKEAKRKIQSKSVDPEIKSHCETLTKNTLGDKDYDWILSCIEEDERQKVGSSDLFTAIKVGYTEEVRTLLTTGVDIEAKDEGGYTALIRAVSAEHPEIVKILITAGADINTKDEGGKAALMWAASIGHPEIVKILINAGADVNIKTNLGITALMSAAYRGHTETVKVLVEAGADINAKDKEGKTALEYATKAGHAEIANLLKRYGTHR